MIYDTGEEFMLSHIVKFVRYIRRARLKIELDTRHRKRVQGYGVQSVLTEEQKKEIEQFYAPYAKVDTRYHDFYTAVTGNYHVNYLPDNLYYTKIDQY